MLLGAAPAFGQIESNTLTISATRSWFSQPDEIALELSVSSNRLHHLDQIVGALSGLGVTDANLTGIYSSVPPTLSWNFSFAAPIAEPDTTIGSITQLQQSIAQNNSGLTLTFYHQWDRQVSQQLQQSQTCSNSDLIADASAQAQKLAAAAGLTLGPVLEVSNAPSSQRPQSQHCSRPSKRAFSGSLALASSFRARSPHRLTCSLVSPISIASLVLKVRARGRTSRPRIPPPESQRFG